MTPTTPIPSADRQRLSLDLAPGVTSLLDHISAVTGLPKSQIVVQALLEALPALLERADQISKKQAALVQSQNNRQQQGKR